MEIEIKEKPEFISWEKIRALVFEAHESNRQKGVDIRNAHLSAEGMKQSIGDDGICVVALDNSQLVGTCSVAFRDMNCWFARGKSAYFTLAAVAPNYKGKGIFSRLEKKRIEIVRQLHIDTAFMYVAENNTIRRNIARKYGFCPVEIRYNPYNSHNFIVYCKYFSSKGFPFRLYAKCRFIAQKLKLKTKQWVKKQL